MANYNKIPHLSDITYKNLLQQKQKPISVHSLIKPPKGSLGAPTPIIHNIPPLNTNIQFSKLLPSFSIKHHLGLSAITTVPENFSWNEITSSDSDDIKNKKQMITSPPNQGMCGDCWAISTASSISDKFVISGLVDFNPNLSTTYAISCYPQTHCDENGNCGGQCNGGNPSKLLLDVSSKGLSSSHCIDYSWCDSNQNCIKKNKENLQLNTLIPNCGCINGKVEHYLYKVDKNIEVISVTQNQSIETTSLNVKKHIFSKGSALTGFLVINNFIDGLFALNKNTKGIYIDHYDYINDKFYDPNVWSAFIDDISNNCFPIGSGAQPSQTQLQLLGGHAVAIIGWGIEKGLFTKPDGTKEDVPYWIARNSWTEKWADNGYFKIAMFPVNKVSQFDQNLGNGGGTILFSVSEKPTLTSLPQVDNKYITNLSKNLDYYSTDPSNSSEAGISINILNGSTSQASLGKKIFVFLIIFFICVGIYFKRKSNRY
jgi:C1A family cysteine protease